jgi:hypothetical protein
VLRVGVPGSECRLESKPCIIWPEYVVRLQQTPPSSARLLDGLRGHRFEAHWIPICKWPDKSRNNRAERARSWEGSAGSPIGRDSRAVASLLLPTDAALGDAAFEVHQARMTEDGGPVSGDRLAKLDPAARHLGLAR